VAPDFATLREICRLGLPMGLSFFLEVMAFSVIALLIATLGNTAMASHQIAFSVWDATYMLLISVGSAMATRVGHAIGGRDKPMVHMAIRCGAAIALLLGLLCMAVLQSIPALIISVYTQDDAIYGMAITLIRLAGLFIALDAIQVTTTFALRAFKDTRFPFVVLCSCYWLVTLPLGYWLGIVVAQQQPLLGTVGFWKGMIAGIALSGLVLGWRLLNTLRQPLPQPTLN
jgi:MATE family multidrug resistance protein